MEPRARVAAYGTGGARLRRGVALLLLALVSLPLALPAEEDGAGGGYTVDWFSIDGGGELISHDPASGFEIGGSIGQPDAGAAGGSDYALRGGFWVLAPSQPGQALFRDGFEDAVAR